MKKLVALLLVVFTMLLVGCSGSSVETYTGKAQGYQSEIEVEVALQGDKITEIKVISHGDTPGISDGVIEDTPKAIIEAQSADIDALTGATKTSQGIIDAVKDALAKANK